MSGWQLTPRARRDLFEIWDYIAEDDSTAANRLEQAVYESCDLLSKSPLAGFVRENLTSLPVRSLSEFKGNGQGVRERRQRRTRFARLRGRRFAPRAYPALTDRANLCRASGAGVPRRQRGSTLVRPFFGRARRRLGHG